MALADARDAGLAGLHRQELFTGVLADPGTVQYGTVTKDDTTTGTSITPGLPSDIVAGDILVVMCVAFGRSTALAAPAGYTLLTTSTNGGNAGASGTGIVYMAAWKTAVGGDTAPSVATTSPNRGAKAWMSRFRPKGSGSVSSLASMGAITGVTSLAGGGSGGTSDIQQLIRVHRFVAWDNFTAASAPPALTGRVTLPAVVSPSATGTQQQTGVTPIADDVSTGAGTGALGAAGETIDYSGASATAGNWTWGSNVIPVAIYVSYRDSGYAAPISAALVEGLGQQKGAWTELFASTNFDSKALDLDVLPVVPSTGAIYYSTLEIGIGAAGAEVPLMSDIGVLHQSGTYDGATATVRPIRLHIPIRIPAGSRVAARAYMRPTANGPSVGPTMTIYPDLVD